jgi:hypothetical protein
LHSLRERRIQPHPRKWALRKNDRRGTMQRHQLMRE